MGMRVTLFSVKVRMRPERVFLLEILTVLGDTVFLVGQMKALSPQAGGMARGVLYTPYSVQIYIHFTIYTL